MRLTGNIILFTFSFLAFLNGQDNLVRIEDFCKKNEREILKEYFDFLSLPNFALNKEDIYKNAFFIPILHKRLLSKK